MNNIIFMIFTFLVGILIIILALWIVARLKIKLFGSLALTSLGLGLGFGTMAFMFTYIDDQPNYWTIMRRLTVGGEVFLWAWLGTFLLGPIAVFITKLLKGENV